MKKILITAAAALSMLTLTACDNDMKVSGVRFDSLPLAVTDAEKTSVRVTKGASLVFENGKTKRINIDYNTIYRTNDSDGNTVVGTLINQNGQPITMKDGSKRVSTQPDTNTIFVRDGKYYIMTHFEESPGALYMAELEEKGGKFTAKKFVPVDFSKVGGTFINCAGSKTPWDTHLASEEDYYLDAIWFDPSTKGFMSQHVAYCDRDASGRLTGEYTAPAFDQKADNKWWCELVKGISEDYMSDTADFTPYNYGYNAEIDVKNGKPYIVGGTKIYITGKHTPEMALVMPDNKTVFTTDDGSYTGLYMTVLDNEKDFSAGTLYIAKWNQTKGGDGGVADLSWIRLEHATNSELYSIIKRKPMLSDMFDMADPKTCPSDKGFSYIKAGDAEDMCVRLRDGSNGTTISPVFKSKEEMLMAAAFLESRKYGAVMGGTTEFRKEEGMAYNSDKNTVYIAMSSIDASMEDKSKDPVNMIALKKNKCGGVYEMSLGKADGANNTAYAGTRMEAIFTGKQLKDGEPGSDMYYCDPERISNPDNLKYFPGLNLLIVGEDTKYHFNNMVWAYDTNTKDLTRIATVPTGGEVTGMFSSIVKDGMLYVFMNTQHPFEDAYVNAKNEKVNSGLLKKASRKDMEGHVGYFTGIPVK